MKKYVGVNGMYREYFRSQETPTETSHPQYKAVIGPFRTKRAALFMCDQFKNCQSVADAERISRQQAAERISHAIMNHLCKTLCGE